MSRLKLYFINHVQIMLSYECKHNNEMPTMKTNFLLLAHNKCPVQPVHVRMAD